MLEKLSPAAISRKAEYRKPGRYADGGGLYLQVTPKADRNGITRAWLFQYSWKGKVRQMGLGSFLNVSLSQARKRAKAALDKVADGIDPIAERRAATAEAFSLRPSKHSPLSILRRIRPHGGMKSTESNGLRHSSLTPIQSSAG
jgi:hypothetical protein